MNTIQQRNADLARAKSRVEAEGSDIDRELVRLRLHLADATRTEERVDYLDTQVREALVTVGYPVDPSPHAEAHLLAAPVAIRELGAERDRLREEIRLLHGTIERRDFQMSATVSRYVGLEEERDRLRVELAAIKAAAGPVVAYVGWADGQRHIDKVIVGSFWSSGSASDITVGQLRALAAVIAVKGVENG